MDDINSRCARISRVLCRELGTYRARAFAADFVQVLLRSGAHPQVVAWSLARRARLPDPAGTARAVVRSWNDSAARPRRETIAIQTVH